MNELKFPIAFVAASMLLFQLFGFAGVITTDSDGSDGALVITVTVLANLVLGLFGALMYYWGKQDGR